MDKNIQQLREKHWQEFVNAYINPLKTYSFPKIEEKEGYNNFYVHKKSCSKDYSLSMSQINFIYNLLKAQKEKEKLLPYIWVWALSFNTINISEYCQKRLYKTLLLNGFEEYPGMQYSIKFGDNKFDEDIIDSLDDPDLKPEEFCKMVKIFVNDYQIKS